MPTPSWLHRLTAAFMAVALSSASLAAQPAAPSKNFEKAVKTRLQVLANNQKLAAKEGGEFLKKATKELRSSDPERLQWHERGRAAVDIWMAIIADEQAFLEALRTETPAYGPLKRRGDYAFVSALRLKETEDKLAYAETDSVKRLAASQAGPSNPERDQAIQAEQLALQKARVALEEERTTLDFVLLNTVRDACRKFKSVRRSRTSPGGHT